MTRIQPEASDALASAVVGAIGDVLGARSTTYPWRDAALCESRGPTGEFCRYGAGHDGGHYSPKGCGCVLWFRDNSYWDGRQWVHPL